MKNIVNEIPKFLLPFIIVILIIWLSRSKVLGLDEWAEKRKKEVDQFRAKKRLKRNVAKAKNEKHFKEQ